MKPTKLKHCAFLWFGFAIVSATLIAEEVNSPPRVISNEILYPPDMLTNGIQGTVTVELVILADASIARVKVLEATNDEFASAAKDAVSNWKFKPAIHNGKPVAAKVRQTLVYEPQKWLEAEKKKQSSYNSFMKAQNEAIEGARTP